MQLDALQRPEHVCLQKALRPFSHVLWEISEINQVKSCMKLRKTYWRNIKRNPRKKILGKIGTSQEKKTVGVYPRRNIKENLQEATTSEIP